jgi:hypothetical protein
VTIILGGDSSNKTFSLKEQDARNLFFFHNSRIIFRAAAMSGATLFMIYQGFYEATLELVAPTKTLKEPWEILNKIYSGVEKIKKI